MTQAKRSNDIDGDQGSAKRGERHQPEIEEGEQSPISERVGASEQAGYSGRLQGSSGRTREEEDLKSISSQSDDFEKDGVDSFEQEELSGSDSDDDDSIGYSDTDEDEDEGLGDGNLGRTVREDVDE